MTKIKKYAGRKILFCILCGMILLTSAGCGQEGMEDEPNPSQVSPAPSESAPATEEPEQSEELNCNWTLSVDDTQTLKVNGYTMTCTLKISAVKEGGTDTLGTYTGSAALSYTYDMQKGNVQGNADGKGQDQNVSFDMVAYEVKTYTAYGVTVKNGELAPIGPLTDQETMGLGIFVLTGSGNSKETAGSGSWSTEESKTVQVPFKIAVGGGEAIIELPTIAPGAVFKGTVTGTPVE